MNCNPPKKNHSPSFPATPSKNWDPVKPPVFENLFSGSHPNWKGREGNTMLVELPGFLTGLGLYKLQHLIYTWLLLGFGMLVFFTNLSHTEFQVRYLSLFLFSVIDSSGQDVFTTISSSCRISSSLHSWSYNFLTIH